MSKTDVNDVEQVFSWIERHVEKPWGWKRDSRYFLSEYRVYTSTVNLNTW